MEVYSVRTEFPQSTKLDLPSAGLLAISSAGDMHLAPEAFIRQKAELR